MVTSVHNNDQRKHVNWNALMAVTAILALILSSLNTYDRVRTKIGVRGNVVRLSCSHDHLAAVVALVNYGKADAVLLDACLLYGDPRGSSRKISGESVTPQVLKPGEACIVNLTANYTDFENHPQTVDTIPLEVEFQIVTAQGFVRQTICKLGELRLPPKGDTLHAPEVVDFDTEFKELL